MTHPTCKHEPKCEEMNEFYKVINDISLYPHEHQVKVSIQDLRKGDCFYKVEEVRPAPHEGLRLFFRRVEQDPYFDEETGHWTIMANDPEQVRIIKEADVSYEGVPGYSPSSL